MPLVLFVLSALVLSLEVLETKIFAYSLENSLIFLVVGVVLLGFGAGGSVLSLRKQLGDIRPLVRTCLWVTAGLLVVAHALFAKYSHLLSFAFDLPTIGLLAALASPYISAGMAISALLAEPGADVHRRYALNLVGSAVGCLLPFFVLGPLTGPEGLVACAIACGLLAACYSARKPIGFAVVAALGVPTFLYADDILPYQIQGASTAGQLALIEKSLAEVVEDNDGIASGRMVEEFDRWDPTARVQVHSVELELTDDAPDDLRATKKAVELSRWFTQDSSYGSPLLARGVDPESPSVKGVYERSCYAVGYFRQKADPSVLVIGLGGAPDIQTALHQGASRIVGVDINATTVEMVRSSQSDYLGKPYQDERFEVHLSDGRSFVRSTDEKFDLLQLSGVDTKSVLASGTLALNESYLYTEEAFDEYLARLKDDGVLCINYSGVDFRHRLTLTALEALSRRGAERPDQHVMLLQQNAIFSLLVKPTPFTAEEIAQMRAFLAKAKAGSENPDTFVVVWVYELLTPGLSLVNPPVELYLPDSDLKTPPGAGNPNGPRHRVDQDLALFDAVRKDLASDVFPQRTFTEQVDGESVERWTEVRKYLDARDLQLEPVPDSRPFFFNTTRNGDAILRFADTFGLLGERPVPGVRARTEPFARTFSMLLVMSVLAFLLILGPLGVLGVRGVATARTVPFALYFAALGAGFILAMSGLIQRYVLFLGHQSYAFSVVIGGLLVAAGIGSALAGLFSKTPRRTMTVAVVMIWAMLAGIHQGLDSLFDATAGWSRAGRIALGAGVLLPLGIPLGMMFPTGLAVVKQQSPLFVPWAFGINGVFSVIGTTVVLPGALLFGFPTMAMAAALVYGLALVIGLLAAPARMEQASS